MPGYFHYADTVDIGSFTPHTVATLLARRQLAYRPHVRLDFLSANRLGAGYYLALSQQRLRQHQPDSALAALTAAENRQPSLQLQPTPAALRARAHQQLGNYPTAVRWVTQALGYATKNYQAAWRAYEALDNLYRQRQHLYLLQRDYPAALADHDSVAALLGQRNPEYRRASRPAIDRAFFLADSLRRSASYRDAVRLLRPLVPAKPGPEWPCDRRLRLSNRPAETSLANNYFRLGLAEYRDRQYPAAFEHWHLALVEGQAYEQGAAYVAHFDSLLTRWPAQPLLLMGRAIAHLHFSLALYEPGSYVYVPGNYEAALSDLNRAEQQGFANVEVYYYQALALKGLERWEEMRRQLEVAIGKAPQVGELYLLRRDARVGLKEAKYEDPADPDWIAYHRLCPSSH